MYRQKLIQLLVKTTPLPEGEVENLIAIPPNPSMGDYAFPCFKLGSNPKEAAESLQKKLTLPKFVAKTQVMGSYLNFFLNPSIIAQETLTKIKKEKKNYGKGNAKKNIVIEYCGPNTNKPLHLGHMRNMALGNAMARIIAFQRNKVHQVNIVNDRGIHICQSMIAYQKWGNKELPNKKGDHFVGDFYVKFAQELQKNEALKDEAQEMLQKWEKHDPKVRALCKKMNSWVLKGFAQTYKRFDVSFEKEYFESELYEKGKEVALEGFKKNIFIKDETGAIIAPLEKYGISDKIILRGDGTSVYITQDMYLAQKRYQDFKFDRSIYVVASEQNLHFKQLFKILELLGRPYAKNLYHLSYGMVNLPSGRMKSREGTVIDADDFMDEMSAMAEKEVRARYKDLSEKEIKYRSEQIGLAAIKFFMVRTDAARDIVFNPEESLQFEGETGPYLQYTRARAGSIIRKAAVVKGKVNYDLLSSPSEQNLIKLLLQFSLKLEETAEQFRPHILGHFLLNLAQAFNEFYHSSQVISEDKELMKARLQLVYGVKQVLQNGLELLGITALEEM